MGDFKDRAKTAKEVYIKQHETLMGKDFFNVFSMVPDETKVTALGKGTVSLDGVKLFAFKHKKYNDSTNSYDDEWTFHDTDEKWTDPITTMEQIGFMIK